MSTTNSVMCMLCVHRERENGKNEWKTMRNIISHIVFSQNASCRRLYSYWKHKNSWINKKGGRELYYIGFQVTKI